MGRYNSTGFCQNKTLYHDAKEYLENYLTKVQNIKNTDVNAGINPLAAEFELSRWGEEGLLDNWSAIMAIINQKL